MSAVGYKFQELAIILHTSVQDGAFNFSGPPAKAHRRVIDETFPCVASPVSSVSKALHEIIDTLGLIGKRSLGYLEFAGHGSPSSVEFSKDPGVDQRIEIDGKHWQALEKLLSYMGKGGVLVLQSCQGALKDRSRPGLAERLCELAPQGVFVYGSRGTVFDWDYRSVDPRCIDLRFLRRGNDCSDLTGIFYKKLTGEIIALDLARLNRITKELSDPEELALCRLMVADDSAISYHEQFAALFKSRRLSSGDFEATAWKFAFEHFAGSEAMQELWLLLATLERYSLLITDDALFPHVRDLLQALLGQEASQVDLLLSLEDLSEREKLEELIALSSDFKRFISAAMGLPRKTRDTWYADLTEGLSSPSAMSDLSACLTAARKSFFECLKETPLDRSVLKGSDFEPMFQELEKLAPQLGASSSDGSLTITPEFKSGDPSQAPRNGDLLFYDHKGSHYRQCCLFILALAALQRHGELFTSLDNGQDYRHNFAAEAIYALTGEVLHSEGTVIADMFAHRLNVFHSILEVYQQAKGRGWLLDFFLQAFTRGCLNKKLAGIQSYQLKLSGGQEEQVIHSLSTEEELFDFAANIYPQRVLGRIKQSKIPLNFGDPGFEAYQRQMLLSSFLDYVTALLKKYKVHVPSISLSLERIELVARGTACFWESDEELEQTLRQLRLAQGIHQAFPEQFPHTGQLLQKLSKAEGLRSLQLDDGRLILELMLSDRSAHAGCMPELLSAANELLLQDMDKGRWLEASQLIELGTSVFDGVLDRVKVLEASHEFKALVLEHAWKQLEVSIRTENQEELKTRTVQLFDLEKPPAYVLETITRKKHRVAMTLSWYIRSCVINSPAPKKSLVAAVHWGLEPHLWLDGLVPLALECESLEFLTAYVNARPGPESLASLLERSVGAGRVKPVKHLLELGLSPCSTRSRLLLLAPCTALPETKEELLQILRDSLKEGYQKALAEGNRALAIKCLSASDHLAISSSQIEPLVELMNQSSVSTERWDLQKALCNRVEQRIREGDLLGFRRELQTFLGYYHRHVVVASSSTASPRIEALHEALIDAVRSESLEILKELLEAGASINVRETSWGIPIMSQAVKSGNREIFDYLTAKGADPDPYCSPEKKPIVFARHKDDPYFLDCLKGPACMEPKPLGRGKPSSWRGRTVRALEATQVDLLSGPVKTPKRLQELMKFAAKQALSKQRQEAIERYESKIERMEQIYREQILNMRKTPGVLRLLLPEELPLSSDSESDEAPD